MKKVLITGSAGGIGKSIVSHFLQRGWYVFASDVSQNGLDELPAHENMRTVHIDVCSEPSIESALSELRSVTPSIDGLINNAGVFDHFPLAEARSNQFAHVIDVNVLGAARMTAAFFPMLHSAHGRIVNISSETAMASLPMQVYGVSKRMLEVYTDSLRQEVGLVGIKVVLVRPGAHETMLLSLSKERLGIINEDSVFREELHIVRDKGQGIIGQGAANPKDVAEVVYKSMTVSNPKRIYHVNVSIRFRVLSFLPRRMKEFFVRRILTPKA